MGHDRAALVDDFQRRALGRPRVGQQLIEPVHIEGGGDDRQDLACRVEDGGGEVDGSLSRDRAHLVIADHKGAGVDHALVPRALDRPDRRRPRQAAAARVAVRGGHGQVDVARVLSEEVGEARVAGRSIVAEHFREFGDGDEQLPFRIEQALLVRGGGADDVQRVFSGLGHGLLAVFDAEIAGQSEPREGREE
jgi:hypothetical protein